MAVSDRVEVLRDRRKVGEIVGRRHHPRKHHPYDRGRLIVDHPGQSPARSPPSRWSFGDLTSRAWFWPIFALALIFIVDGVVSPGFFSIRIVQGRLFGSLIDVLYRGTPTALVALGMAVVIGTKGIDLSVGAVVAIVGAVMTNLIHRDMSPPLVLALTLGAGLLCGLWNGFLVAILDIQPIIATLILMVAGRGIALLIDEGLIVTFRSDFFSAISTGEFLTVPSRIIVCRRHTRPALADAAPHGARPVRRVSRRQCRRGGPCRDQRQAGQDRRLCALRALLRR